MVVMIIITTNCNPFTTPAEPVATVAIQFVTATAPLNSPLPTFSVALPATPYEQLTKTENTLLRYLQARSRLAIPTEQLLAEVWKRPDASTRRVQEAIRRLRHQLEQLDPPLGIIENDRGRGYRFVPAVFTIHQP